MKTILPRVLEWKVNESIIIASVKILWNLFVKFDKLSPYKEKLIFECGSNYNRNNIIAWMISPTTKSY